jgi:hypothetical protein
LSERLSLDMCVCVCVVGMCVEHVQRQRVCVCGW